MNCTHLSASFATSSVAQRLGPLPVPRERPLVLLGWEDRGRARGLPALVVVLVGEIADFRWRLGKGAEDRLMMSTNSILERDSAARNVPGLSILLVNISPRRSVPPQWPRLPPPAISKLIDYLSGIAGRWLARAVSSLIDYKGHSGLDCSRHRPAPRCLSRSKATAASRIRPLAMYWSKVCRLSRFIALRTVPMISTPAMT